MMSVNGETPLFVVTLVRREESCGSERESAVRRPFWIHYHARDTVLTPTASQYFVPDWVSYTQSNALDELITNIQITKLEKKAIKIIVSQNLQLTFLLQHLLRNRLPSLGNATTLVHSMSQSSQQYRHPRCHDVLLRQMLHRIFVV